MKAKSVLDKYDNAIASISGGADSDIVLDILAHLDKDKRIDYVWFDTGLEYQATKDHLKYLEERYGIKIQRLLAVKPVAACAREYGQPFISKNVSEQIQRLQAYNFSWEDKPFDDLKNTAATSAVKWWCSEYGGNSKFSISNNKGLKAFLVKYPPKFKISSKCCTYAKKKTAAQVEKNHSLKITGVRKAEGGVRSTAYSGCYNTSNKSIDSYRPVFWYKQENKADYNRIFNIRNSDCYRVWGLKRTGCAGCPYNRELEDEIKIIEQYEPKLYKACNYVFKDSYEYTRKYREFNKQ